MAMKWISIACLVVMTMDKAGGLSSTSQAREQITRARRSAPELFMTAPEMIASHGYEAELHSVQTADGYIITLHRIPNRRAGQHRRPIFLQHGLVGVSDVWVYDGPHRSLAFLLADRGYDVWLGNTTGNFYSWKHVSMNTSDPDFWKFSFHEMGLYDIPAALDHVLKTTGEDSLYYVGHSLGNHVIYVTLSMLPQYNSKVRMVVCLAPTIFLKYIKSPLVRDLVFHRKFFTRFLDIIKQYELFPLMEASSAAWYFMCRDGSAGQQFCEKLWFQVNGVSSGLNKTMLPMYLSRLTGASAFTAFHLVQNLRSGKFRPWDHGPQLNQLVFGSSQPPEYDLSRIRVPVALHGSDSNYLVPLPDVEEISKLLPNMVELRRVPVRLFNHFDFFSHEDVKHLLHDHVMASIERH